MALLYFNINLLQWTSWSSGMIQWVLNRLVSVDQIKWFPICIKRRTMPGEWWCPYRNSSKKVYNLVSDLYNIKCEWLVIITNKNESCITEKQDIYNHSTCAWWGCYSERHPGERYRNISRSSWRSRSNCKIAGDRENNWCGQHPFGTDSRWWFKM